MNRKTNQKSVWFKFLRIIKGRKTKTLNTGVKVEFRKINNATRIEVVQSPSFLVSEYIVKQ